MRSRGVGEGGGVGGRLRCTGGGAGGVGRTVGRGAGGGGAGAGIRGGRGFGGRGGAGVGLVQGKCQSSGMGNPVGTSMGGLVPANAQLSPETTTATRLSTRLP
ncbi:hypothetical protein [Streptomyces sp. NPDC017993]|uniref:hypothetical protein n=1 Tax=Streptomyces sp. NPDC017993 TaxID=3365027 RepID=UPI0037A39D15